MLLKPLTLAAAGVAVVTQAFLLPPEVSGSDIEAAKSLPVGAHVVPDHKSLNLTCPNCPVAFKSRHGSAKIKTDKASHLELDFVINHELDHDRLFVNDFELYPSSDPFHSSLSAAVVLDDVGKKHKKHHKYKSSSSLPAHLGFSLQVRPVVHNQQDSLQLVALDLQIIEVATMLVNGIPNVHVKLIKDASGKLAIAHIETTESLMIASTPMNNQGECTTLLCRWMTIAKDKLAQMKLGKGCEGKMSTTTDESQPDRHHHNHNHQNHGDRPDETHRPHHRPQWRLLFKNIATNILLPVAVGIIAGVTVSL